MQISRIATAVAAGVIAPTVFLAAPAVADDKPAVPAGSVVTPPKKDGEQDKTTDQTATTKTVLTVKDFTGTFKAGGDATGLSVDIDNSKGDRTFDGYAVFFHLEKSEQKIDPADVKAQFWDEAKAAWQNTSMDKAVGGGGVLKVEKGKIATLRFRIGFSAKVPAGKGTFQLRAIAGGMDKSIDPDPITVNFDVTAAEKESPKPSQSQTSGTHGKPSPSASKPATAAPSASASASATPSASASPTAATDASSGSGPSAAGGEGELAATGSSTATPWIAAGAAAAIVAGAAIVIAVRRRQSA
ncbi:LAETG motif-containing sortase-dependent surface protein [Streptomyces sp. NPDC049577]|uniref:LAETG motif-containing sortase-dependent surface protein n=1 Tax=Streptomyces sp. NPDC049577 TaxID=3155153 RepID=UPI00343B846A